MVRLFSSMITAKQASLNILETLPEPCLIIKFGIIMYNLRGITRDGCRGLVTPSLTFLNVGMAFSLFVINNNFFKKTIDCHFHVHLFPFFPEL